jgi:hypothetical protein
LPRVSRQLRLSANHKGDNEMIAKAVHIPTGINLTAKKNPGNPRR